MSGRLGDFLYSLCIPKHIYNTRNTKANIFLSEKGDIFRLGLEKTFNDLKNIMLHQPYVNSFQIYNDELIDIDMTNWRKPHGYWRQFKLTWNELFFKLYLNDVPVPQELTNMQKTKNIEKYNDWLIINRAPYYNMKFFDNKRRLKNKSIANIYEDYMNKYKNIGFIFYEEEQYDKFPYKDVVEPIKVSNLEEMINIIGSSKMFMGNQSGPLAIAAALNTNRIIESTHPMAWRVHINDHKYFKKVSYF